jgi:hypothetical protein
MREGEQEKGQVDERPDRRVEGRCSGRMDCQRGKGQL